MKTPENKPASTVRTIVRRFTLWSPQPPRENAPVCACGNKYLKTRLNQTQCLKCILNPKNLSRVIRL